MIEQSCAFTGHRPTRFTFAYDEADPRCVALKAKLAEEIEKMIKEGVNRFYSGMALGVDQWAAQAVLNLKASYSNIQLIAVLPCENQSNRWSSEQQTDYSAILEKCGEIQTIGKHYTPQRMFQRNRRLVDQARHLIAVYDGKPGGGTAYTVNYALRKGRKVTVIDNQIYHQ